MPGMNQGVPNMAAFGQGPAQGMPGASGGGGSYMPGGQPQGYQRTSSQDLAYGYGSQSGAGVSFGLSDGTDLDSTEVGWKSFSPANSLRDFLTGHFMENVICFVSFFFLLHG